MFGIYLDYFICGSDIDGSFDILYHVLGIPIHISFIFETYYKQMYILNIMTPRQTWKMSETLPEQDCSFPDFTRKCANYVNFEIATKQRNLSANTMFTQVG